MRLLVEFSHPAQVHKFKHLLQRMKTRGAAVKVLSRDKDVMLDLLDDLGIDHICLSQSRPGYAGAFLELLIREWRTFLAVLRFRPTILLSAHSVAITHIGWLLRIPRVVHEDTEFATLQQRLYIPFASKIVTTRAYYKDWGPRQIRIDSLEPLAYLHPNQFRPNKQIPAKYGLSPDTPYVVLRFISWQALHDRDVSGFSDNDVKRLIDAVTAAGVNRIVISAECPRIRINSINVITPDPSDLHDILAFASLCVSESITVAGEAAVLGVPTILMNPLVAGHNRELERYGLIERITDVETVLARIREILGDSPSLPVQSKARCHLFAKKTSFTDAFETILLDTDRRQRPAV